MRLPFTHEEFLDVFARYNATLWPGALVLWLLTAWAIVGWVRKGEAASLGLAAVLALHWAWSALAYHLAFFRAINPAASLFALLFVVQAALFAWLGLAGRRLRWRLDRSPAGVLAAALVAYGMLYPAVNLAAGLDYPRMPAFGVPCPTTIVTAGVLLAAVPGSPRLLNVIPLLWAFIGGSAAFALGIRADLGLAAAGLVLLVHTIAPRLLRRGAAAGASHVEARLGQG